MADMLPAALGYAAAGYEVFPLRGETPAIPSLHPKEERCRGECGRDGHGVLDATTDPGTVARWWQARPTANIGVRVPASLIVVDVDPRHGGDRTLADHVARHGPLPPTRISLSGRGDGGRHLWWRHPGGTLTAAGLGPGLDLKTHTGYVVVPPSVHPDTGRPYTWQTPGTDPAPLPAWLRALMRPPPPPPRSRPGRELSGPTVADRLSWAQILPGTWCCLDPDPDADGARWRHPAATNRVSATVRHGCLFVYSTGTPFPVTEAGDPHGITKLKAYALLYHRGDCKAAYRQLSGGGSR